MNRIISIAAFVLGLAAVFWVGVGYVGTSFLALTMTLLIGAVYVAGAAELLRFHQATATLAGALAAIPDNLPEIDNWLARIHPSLQNPVRLRIEGERIGLPGPTMTPYLVGLLVLLGMLGTFLGMVVTLNGAVIALESSTDVQTIRGALSAPVKGLGVAFGTSIAGVAASAMLGLISSLCRKARLQASQVLDSRVATVLRSFSLSHQRRETYAALQFQSRALPEVVDKLQAMMALMENQSRQLNEQLLANQSQHYRDAQTLFADLAASVDQTLKSSLSQSSRLAAEAIQPVVQATMAGIAEQTQTLHASLSGAVGSQLEALTERFKATVAQVNTLWAEALAAQSRTSEDLSRDTRQTLAGFATRFEQGSAALLSDLSAAQAVAQAEASVRDEQRLAAMSQTLASLATSLQKEWQAAGAQNLAQQQALCQTLAQTTQELNAQAQARTETTIQEVARLMATAAEAPRAAAEVISQLRLELANSLARDKDVLEERSRIMATLATLLDAINHASTEQRGAIDALVNSSTALLERAGSRFEAGIAAESEKMADVAARVTSGAVEVASLGEALGFAVQLFSESNEKLTAAMQRIEGALGKSLARSDDQLAYYVAQAKEIIDLSIMSQKQILEDLRKISGRGDA